jgi:hypothetical protein
LAILVALALVRSVAGRSPARAGGDEGPTCVVSCKAGTISEREQRFERGAELPLTSERKLMTTIAATGIRSDVLWL